MTQTSSTPAACNRHDFDEVSDTATCGNCGITMADLNAERAARAARRTSPAGIPDWAAGVVAANTAKDRKDYRESYYRRTGR